MRFKKLRPAHSCATAWRRAALNRAADKHDSRRASFLNIPFSACCSILITRQCRVSFFFKTYSSRPLMPIAAAGRWPKQQRRLRWRRRCGQTADCSTKSHSEVENESYHLFSGKIHLGCCCCNVCALCMRPTTVTMSSSSPIWNGKE